MKGAAGWLRASVSVVATEVMEVKADFILFSPVPAGCPWWLTMESQYVKEIFLEGSYWESERISLSVL